MLALFIEHVLLLAIQVLDDEAIHGELAIGRQPLLRRGQRNGEEFRIEPRHRLAGLCKQDLHLLALRVDLVVPLVFVVAQRGEVPHLIGELADVVGELQGAEQLVGAFR